VLPIAGRCAEILRALAKASKGSKRVSGKQHDVPGEQLVAGVGLRSRKAVSRVVADEAIVVPIREGSAGSGSVYTFNESGTTIWSMIEAGRSAAEVAAYLESEYDISAEQAAEDTQQFIAALAEEGLIEPA
jgi:Coenzyme PQQ synthesis protein D (PqqD)